MYTRKSAWLVALFMASACGGGGSTPTTPAPAPGGNANSINIAIDGDAYRPGGSATYVPGAATVPVGTIVNWDNKDQTAHTVTALNGSFNASLGGGGSFSRQFTAAGTFDYRCTLHPTMQGSVTVR